MRRRFLFFVVLFSLLVCNTAGAQHPPPPNPSMPDHPPTPQAGQDATAADLDIPSLTGAHYRQPFQISLFWSSAPSATSYDLRFWSRSGGHVDLGDFTGTSYTHTGLSAGTEYAYWVRALDANGNVSGWSSRVVVTPIGHLPGMPSVNFGIYGSVPPVVKISWGPVAHAEYYTVLASTSPCCNWINVSGSLTGTSYNHTVGNLETWYYSVGAHNQYGDGVPSLPYRLLIPHPIPTDEPASVPADDHVITIPDHTPTPTRTLCMP